ncbi:MAG: energy transducer TonB [Terracidiphilus sp.]
MGTLTTPEYETLDDETHPDETRAGGVKHNSWMGQEKMGVERDGLPLGRRAKSPEAAVTVATMPNDLLIEPDTETPDSPAIMDGVELDLSFGVPVEEKPIFIDLYESLRDIFFPPKLPPLELTSTPIPVPDRMAVKRNPWAVAASAVVNGGILAALLIVVVKPMVTPKPPEKLAPIDLTDYKPPKPDIIEHGGGGSPDKTPVDKGKLPPKAPEAPPKVDLPTPSVNVAPDVFIPNDPTLPNFGLSSSPNVKLGLGNGKGTGLGSGNGSGVGDGSGGGFGGGVYTPGGNISAPVALYAPDPEFSDEARRAKYQGVVIVSLIVDAQGNPQNPRVSRALGMGLDEKALEAVTKFKFKPCYRDGKTPVPCRAAIEINFRLY